MTQQPLFEHDAESEGGHRQTVGALLIGLGLGFAAFSAVGLWVWKLSFGFISGEAMLMISLGYVALGVWMRQPTDDDE